MLASTGDCWYLFETCSQAAASDGIRTSAKQEPTRTEWAQLLASNVATIRRRAERAHVASAPQVTQAFHRAIIGGGCMASRPSAPSGSPEPQILSHTHRKSFDYQPAAKTLTYSSRLTIAAPARQSTLSSQVQRRVPNGQQI